MTLNKREQARIERRLVVALTEACEIAKAELIGFCWLTHEIDYQVFPSSLVVVWVFDTQQHKDQALAGGQAARMIELTGQALEAAQVTLAGLARHVHFDSEEQCRRVNAGDWPQRLSRLRPARG